MKKLVLVVFLLTFAFQFVHSQGDQLQANRKDLNLTEVGIPKILQAKITVFFKAMIDGNYRSAFENLLKNSPILKKQEDFKNLLDQTKLSFELYGKLHKYEFVNYEIITDSYLRIRYLALHDNYPMRWSFTFYNSPVNGWIVTNVKFDDLSDYYFSDE